MSNYSYSSRPKTSNYLSNVPNTSHSKKGQVNSFHTQSMNSHKHSKKVESKKQSETYDNSKNVSKVSSTTIEDASSTARYSKMNGSHFRTIQEQDSTSLRESDLVQNKSVNNPSENSNEMKIYRGPFSVS